MIKETLRLSLKRGDAVLREVIFPEETRAPAKGRTGFRHEKSGRRKKERKRESVTLMIRKKSKRRGYALFRR
ncbi:hypothetical protein CEXT_603191 [Caerostris extrusa]|uniref:50S ribosomal protein L34 n=1 Tax=Caerostris extrusa TaxID=172846 RepID=A0AAV4N084_CAEEX|nr:hypothetical protein CEXT_603191 [Caerostris extrusa]